MIRTERLSPRPAAVRVLVITTVLWSFFPAAASALPVRVDESVPVINISRHLDYMAAPAGPGIADVAGKKQPWRANDRDYIGFGYVAVPYWFRATILNPTGSAIRQMLEMDMPSLDLVELYLPDENGGFHVTRAGDSLPFGERRINDPNVVFKLNLDPGVTTLYLRVVTAGSLRFRARVYSIGGFFDARSRFLTLAWFIYGMMFLTSMFFLFLFLYIRDRVYLLFSMFIFSLFLFQISLRGFAFQYLWPESPWWANAAIPFFLNISVGLSAIFLRATLETSKNNPCIDRMLIVFGMAVFPAAAVLSVFLPFASIVPPSYYLAMVYGTLLIATILYLFFRKNRFARYFLAGGAVVIIVNIISSLTALGKIPSNFFTEWSMEPAYLCLIFLASLGLVDRMRALEENLRRSEVEIGRRNEDLARSNEELIASNEEFERQNTELVEAQNSLGESEERFRRLIDNSPVAMAIFGSDNHINYFNQKCVELFGYDASDIATTEDGWRLAFPDEAYREKLRTEWRGRADEAHARSAEIAPLEAVFTARDGSKKYIEFRLSSFGDWNLIIFHDLTERRRYETELNRLATAIHQAAEDVIITDAQGSILYVNPAFERVSGYTAAEVMGMNPRILKSGRHDDGFYRDIWTTIRSGNVWNGQIVNRRKNGSLVRMEGSISPIRDAAGAITGYASIRRDITEQAALEAQLMQAQKMEAVGTLVGGLAHDFNNVLGGILGSVSVIELILQEESLNRGEEVRSFIDTMKQSSSMAAGIIHQLLSLSRKQQMEFTAVDLNRSLENVLNLCRNSFPKSVALDFGFHDGPVMVSADPTRIEQAVLNLCLNASNAMTVMRGESAMEGGTLRARTGIATADATFFSANPAPPGEGSHAFIEVSDDGVGMDEETRERIFEPFFTTRGSGGGTGLGLTMAYNIVKQHGGFIDVKSAPDRGSVVTFYLPLARETGPEARPGDGDGIEHGTGTVLVVDDEAAIRMVARAILEFAGYSTLIAADGEEGVRVFRDAGGTIDLVLLDMSMPRMSGIEVLAELKKIDPAVKVLVTSGFSLDEKVRKALDRGAAGFIGKPFTPHMLTARIREILG